MDVDECINEYDIKPIKTLKDNNYHAIIIAVAHDVFKDMGVNYLRKLLVNNGIIYDLKYLIGKDESDLRL